ncbi:glycerol-3-phosphate O-acyltransferase [Schizophyllum amplum]|uniref:Glycerol-3-phosphate O-acyltransferase n=1 Tax=Schizophyllum amplum TaxID=97359 RepID=A0A550BYI0_9AGAR|nr:glycerol-3-phosphate O-acyltransferase [Auriculariopsis ampla]
MSSASKTMAVEVSEEHRVKWSYDTAMFFWKTITHIFFREIRPRGAYNIPRDGPVIFVGAPHNNQFIDPLLLGMEVYKETRRRVRFLAAAKSMQRKAVGFFARLMDSIPVVRAADSAKPATGRVYLSENDPCLVIGVDTKFTEEFSPKMQIMLPKSVGAPSVEIVEIISDTELRVKKEFGGEKGTARIRQALAELDAQGVKGFTFQRLPFVDQQIMYREVYRCLKESGSVGIFPEGGSHDRTDLLPLKAGVAIMALGAMANTPGLQVKVQPVGLSYFHAHRFRSRSVVEFGTAIDVPMELVEMFKQGDSQKHQAIGKMMTLVYDALKTVTVRAPDYDTLMLIQAVRRLYKTPGEHLTLGQVVELNRRLLEGYLHFKDEPRLQKCCENVMKYNRLLRDLGLRDHQVPKAQKANWKVLGLLTYRLLLLLVWTVLALPGGVLNGPIFILASIISRKKAREALAASQVKIAGKDVLATWKILVALGVAPLLYGLWACLAIWLAIRTGAPMKWRIATPFIVTVALPFMNYAALKFGEAGMDVLKSLRPLVVSLLPGQQRSLERLKNMREELADEVTDIINDFGPKLYSDFDKRRILAPSSSAPPPENRPGLWRRKSGKGAVDAPGYGLMHPMTWIDERLFGWSTSAKRGTSAFFGGKSAAPSEAPSHAATPDDTDEEDEGDYDNVIKLIPEQGAFSGRTRSRNSSYADMHRMRVAPMPPAQVGSIDHPASSPESEMDGLQLRQRKASTRQRRESLSDMIPVERIAQVNKSEAFDEATHDLNGEVRRDA